MATEGVSIELELCWERLAAQPPAGENLTTRLAFPRGRKDVFIGLDANGCRHLLVELPEHEEDELVERASRGISVVTRNLHVDADSTIRFIDIICLESPGYAALDVVAVELADALDSGASIARASLVRNVLAKWRRFWSGTSHGLLSREQQVGLFGELWFFLHWLCPSIGAEIAIDRWRGPLGARHDFEAPKISVEVKTTENAGGRHTIHGIEQLLEPQDGALFFFSLLVRDEGGAPDHLAGLVAQTREMLKPYHDARVSLDALLDEVGYKDEFEREYAKLRLRVRSESLLRVSENFPRLVPASFVNDVPQNVLQVTYDIVVDASATWMVARTPDAAGQILGDFISS